MTLSKRIIFAVLAGWINRILTISLNLIFIRLLFRHMGLEEQGFWVLLGSSAAFLSLMDLGVSPTLTRRIALARGKSGADAHATLTEETRSEIGDLVATGARTYRVIALLVFAVSWSLGLYFLSKVTFHDVNARTVWLAWTILCAGYAINVWGQVWQCLLNGVGLVGWNTLVDAGVSLVAITLQIVLVLCGGGLVQLAVVSACSGILSRQVNLAIARRTHGELFERRGRWSWEQFRIMRSPATRYWITALGAFFIFKMDQYFISYFLNTAQLPSYSAAYQIVVNIFIFAISIANGSVVYVSHLWQDNRLDLVHAIVRRATRLGMTLMVCGVACMCVAGKAIIDLWLGPGHFTGYPIVWTFCLMLTLEAHHTIVSVFSRATEDEAYALPAVVSGILNVVFGYILVHKLGIWGVALGTLFAQMLTNNWYMVYRPLRRLKMSIREHVLRVMLPIFAIFLIALGVGWATVRLTERYNSSLVTTGGTAMATGLVLAVALWFYGLSSSDRSRIMRRLAAFSVRRDHEL